VAVAPLIVSMFVAVLTSASAFAQVCSQTGAEIAADRARRDSGARYLIAVNTAQTQAHAERGT